ncbi:palmitoyl-acyl carrier protein thioesterase, chloroplastic-like [Hevea brasiliensis]|uniref:palmitoyl-acyl carrier protein thioesterase, chloroplastic-like n=1 Tax=Hevea brasiliensis TaxID=3981 RepID=UPI0025F9F84B|nr:palmitoyl-acyl carrier protein thioesterase, chloroplastic-like [Hevea brasiliensis]
MNKKTRKISKFKKEIREELAPHFRNCDPIITKDSGKLLQLDVNTADYARTGFTPGWDQLDLNQHVNHVPYINWILKILNAMPRCVSYSSRQAITQVLMHLPSFDSSRSFVEHHELSVITMESWKECNTDSVQHSLAKIVKSGVCYDNNSNNVIELEHLILQKNGSEIARVSTIWKPIEIPAETASQHD